MGLDSAGMLTPTAARTATVSFATGCEGSEDSRNTISGLSGLLSSRSTRTDGSGNVRY